MYVIYIVRGGRHWYAQHCGAHSPCPQLGNLRMKHKIQLKLQPNMICRYYIYIVNCSQSAINACPPETCLPIFIFKPDLNMSGIKFIYISFLQKPVHCKPFITVSSFNLYICTRRAPRSFPCHDNLPTPWCRTCQPNHQNMELPALQKHLER